jgi:hypothetical protein
MKSFAGLFSIFALLISFSLVTYAEGRVGQALRKTFENGKQPHLQALRLGQKIHCSQYFLDNDDVSGWKVKFRLGDEGKVINEFSESASGWNYFPAREFYLASQGLIATFTSEAGENADLITFRMADTLHGRDNLVGELAYFSDSQGVPSLMDPRRKVDSYFTCFVE